jgi:hypothetical protein
MRHRLAIGVFVCALQYEPKGVGPVGPHPYL